MAERDNERSGKQGFASMDDEKQRQVASEGGKASHGGHAQTQAGNESEENDTQQGGGRSHSESHTGGQQGGSQSGSQSGTRGGSHEQHVKAGEQSHKNS